jgi:hypothetical protein
VTEVTTICIVDRQGKIVRECRFDAALWPSRNGKPVFGPYARRLLTAREVLALPAFKAFCAAEKKEATKRQAARWRQDNHGLCLAPLGGAGAVVRGVGA